MSDVMNQEDNPEVALLWTREQEELLKDWCDIANCFRWLHEQASFKYRVINNRIALPVIVLSTLTGTANFGMKSLVPTSTQQLASALVGGVNIFCGILTTIQTYFRYAELTEGHSSASKMWSKFQRLINIELAIEPSKRRHPNEFLKFCIDEYDKLKELSPTIPKDIAAEFKVKFKKTNNVFKPDIYDHLGQTLTYSDYLGRNKNRRTSKSDIHTTDVDELQSIRIDYDDDVQLSRNRLSNTNTSVRETSRNNINKQISNVINKSIREKQYSMESTIVQRPSKDPKGDLEDELKALRPNSKGLINKLNGLGDLRRLPSIADLDDTNKDNIKDTYSRDILSIISGNSNNPSGKSNNPSGKSNNPSGKSSTNKESLDKIDVSSDTSGKSSDHGGKSSDHGGKSSDHGGKSSDPSDHGGKSSDPSDPSGKSSDPSGKSSDPSGKSKDINIESVKNI